MSGVERHVCNFCKAKVYGKFLIKYESKKYCCDQKECLEKLRVALSEQRTIITEILSRIEKKLY